MADTPADNLVQVNFRMPSDLRDRLKDAAKENSRSLNAEIVDRLTASFEENNIEAALDFLQRQRVAADREIYELREGMAKVIKILESRDN